MKIFNRPIFAAVCMLALVFSVLIVQAAPVADTDTKAFVAADISVSAVAQTATADQAVIASISEQSRKEAYIQPTADQRIVNPTIRAVFALPANSVRIDRPPIPANSSIKVSGNPAYIGAVLLL